MSEIWLDKNTGKQFVGRDAAAPFLGYSGDFGGPDLVPLSEIINAKKLDFPTDHFDRPRHTGLTRDDCINYGHWVLTVLTDGDKKRPMRQQHLNRLSELGAGPSFRFVTAFGGLTGFKQVIGAEIRNSRILYADWGLSNFVDHARRVATAVGGKPIEDDYRAFFEADDGPSPYVIADRVGSLAQLHEYIGYPNIHDWEKDEFSIWGAKVLRANPGLGLCDRVISELSRRKYGPSTPTIIDRFGSFAEFQIMAEEEVERLQIEEAETQAKKIAQYQAMIDTGLLAPGLADQPEELLRVGARRLLLEYYLPTLPEEPKRQAATNEGINLIRWILRRNEERGELRNYSLTAGEIEATAVMLNVFDDIWPFRQDIDHLRTNLPIGRRRPYVHGDYRRRQSTRAASR